MIQIDPSLRGVTSAAIAVVIDGADTYYCGASRAREILSRVDPARDVVTREGDGPIVVVIGGTS